MDAPRKFPEREEMSLQIADLIFVRLADIENEQIIPAIEAGLEFARSNFRHLHGGDGSFFAAHAAEFVVIDQLGDRAMRTAHRAIWIFAQLEFAEFHSESVKQEQASYEIIPAAKNQLDRFHRLDRADDSGQNAKDAAFRAGRDKPGRGRFRIEAAVARAIQHAENCGLSFEAEDRAVNIWFAEQDAGVVDEVASGKIVSPIDDDIKVLEKFESVSAG